MNPDMQKDIVRQIKQADQIIFWCIVGLLFLVVVLFAGVIYQNQLNADKSNAIAEKNLEIMRERDLENHRRTQESVICVANSLMKPLTERTNLQSCLIDVKEKTQGAQ